MAPSDPQVRVFFNRFDVVCPALLLAGFRAKGGHGSIRRQPPYFLFHYVESGSGAVVTPGTGQVSVSAGDWFLCFPDQEITYWQAPEDPWSYRWIGFQGDGVAGTLARGGIHPDTGVLRGDRDPTCEELHEAMMDALESDRLTGDLEANALLLRLLAHMIAGMPPTPSPARQVQKGAVAEAVDKACQFMVNGFAYGIRAGDVSDHVGYERSYFSSVFSQLTGTTIRDYLGALRQQKAQELLSETALPVAAIANAVGFESAKTFSRFFRERTGLPPCEWRQQRRG